MPNKKRTHDDQSLSQKGISTNQPDDSEQIGDIVDQEVVEKSFLIPLEETLENIYQEFGFTLRTTPRGQLDSKQLATWQLEAELLLQNSAPENFLQLLTAARELRTAFYSSVASFLQRPFNDHLQSMPHEAYEEKQALASWVNSQLRQLGLAIKCPKTGKPAILLADVKGAKADAGRFRLETRDDSGKRVRTLSSRVLPQLELMEDQVREEPVARWSERIRQAKRGDRSK